MRKTENNPKQRFQNNFQLVYFFEHSWIKITSIFSKYSLSQNVDKLSRNSDKMSRNVDNLPYQKPYCPEILIKCPIMLINCPEILIKPDLFSSFDMLFQPTFIQKSVRPRLTRPQLSKAGSRMVKKEELIIYRQFSSQQKGVVSIGLSMSDI